MENPFFFGNAVSGDRFTGRERITDQLVTRLSSLQNTTLISPVGWGKKSLVNRVGEVISMKNYDFRICYIDLQDIYSEAAFLKTYLAALHYVSASIFMVGGQQQWKLEDILDLPEYIAIRDRVKLVICIGNFHKILYFTDPQSFQKKLKSRMLLHDHCTYCIFGNQKQISSNLLDSPNKLLPSVSKVFRLPRIPFNQWTIFIQKRFRETRKKIPEEVAAEITSRANCLPHFVQLLSWHAWFRTKYTCTSKIIDQAIDHLALHSNNHYQCISDNLTEKQISYLKALIIDNEKLCSHETLEKFRLSSSAHVSRLRSSLINKEIIYSDYAGVLLLDPIYGYWLQNYLFRL